MPRLLFTPGKDLVPLVQEAGWAPGPIWTGAENLAPTGIRSLDRPARSQLLYQLRYPAHLGSLEEQKMHVLLFEEFVVAAFVIKMIKGGVNPITCNEGTDGELRYGSTLS